MSSELSVAGERTETVRVLHIDDEPDFAELTATFLEREKDWFKVETATSPSEGLDRLTKEVDCVISDYDMPGMDGIELLEAVREQYPHLPFVLFTGKGSEEVASDAIAAGVTDYLQKGSGTDQYQLLANRVSIAVKTYRTEQELNNLESKYEMVARVATDGFWEWTIETDTMWLSESFQQNFGYDQEVIEDGFDWGVSQIHPADRDRVTAEIEETIGCCRERTESEYRFQQADGSYVPCLSRRWVITDDDETPIGMIGTLIDLSEQRDHERELKRIKDRFQAFTEYAADLITVVDEDGVIQYESPSIERTLGYDQEALVGENVFDYFHPEDREQLQESFAELLTNPAEVIDKVEYRFNHANGSWVWLESVGSNRTDSTINGFVVTSRDISDRKARESELKLQNERLAEFASVISHDLRSPLTTAAGRLEMVRDECASDHLDPIENALDRMDRIIGDVLWLTREGRDIGSTDPVELHEVVGAAWTIVADGIDSAELTVADGAKHKTIEADADRLRQLLENLLRNALEHGGDDVTVTVGATDSGFYLDDDGPGIPPAERERVFDAGYSTSPEGTGFGLRIVKQIADAHGWEILVTEGADGGARFEIGVTNSGRD